MSEEQPPASPDASQPESPKYKPKSVRYYLNVIMHGNSSQWRALFQQCKESYEVSFVVAQAVTRIPNEQYTVKMLWKNAIECAQKGIDIKLGKDGDDGMRPLRMQKYADGM